MPAHALVRAALSFALTLCTLSLTDRASAQIFDVESALRTNQPVNVTTPPPTDQAEQDSSDTAEPDEATRSQDQPGTQSTTDSAPSNASSAIEPDLRPLPLRRSSDHSDTPRQRPFSLPDGTMRTIGALAVVLMIAVFLRMMVGKKVGLLSTSRSPAGILSVLARYPIGKQQYLVLLRMPGRMLLICQTPTGASTLSEITNPDEVASLHRMLRDVDGDSFNSQFDHLLSRSQSSAARPANSGDDWLDPTPMSESANVIDLTRSTSNSLSSRSSRAGSAMMRLLGWGGARS